MYTGIGAIRPTNASQKLASPAGGLCLRGGWPEEKRTPVLPAGGYSTCHEHKHL